MTIFKSMHSLLATSTCQQSKSSFSPLLIGGATNITDILPCLYVCLICVLIQPCWNTLAYAGLLFFSDSQSIASQANVVSSFISPHYILLTQALIQPIDIQWEPNRMVDVGWKHILQLAQNMHLIFLVDSTYFYTRPNKVYINFSEGKPHCKTMQVNRLQYSSGHQPLATDKIYPLNCVTDS